MKIPDMSLQISRQAILIRVNEAMSPRHVCNIIVKGSRCLGAEETLIRNEGGRCLFV